MRNLSTGLFQEVVIDNIMTDDFDQQRVMPIAAVILLNAANGEKVELPEFQAYSGFGLDSSTCCQILTILM